MPSRVLPVLWEKDRCPLPSLDLTSPALPADTLARFGEQLAETGAILLRGFEVASTEALARAVAALGGKPMPYVEGNSPRTKLDAGEVYTSTEHPPEAFISMHNELSYSASWPNRLYFCCVTPAASGGHTLLASSAAILADLDAAVRDEFEARGVLYIRNLHGGRGMQLGPSWQDSFETTERAEVEAHCTRHRIEFDWRADGALRACSRAAPPASGIPSPASASGSTRPTSSIPPPTAPTSTRRCSRYSATIPSRFHSTPPSATAARSPTRRSRISAKSASATRSASTGNAATAW